ncbi:MAG: tRNA (adenosine(37)-N6)-threonylcarbamoyltransferase complex dimerization subunit type 1 TsaB, partial [Pseudomonadota bacterium]|nr:tRNA (adenosine(37)-N6)-threonylcarbamoyltransferase complex dimerization subunit type 1 TsaB [Pseudomonadota bacterium]
ILEDTIVRAQLSQMVRTSHSEYLMPAIDMVLQCAGIDREELDHLVICRGPGSFSGLRIGIAAMNGLAMALHLPLSSFVNLDLLALQFACWKGTVCPVVDARKGQLYWALYATDGLGGWEKIRDYAVNDPETIVQQINPADTLIVGPGIDNYRPSMMNVAGERLNFLGMPQGMMNLGLVCKLPGIYEQDAQDDAGNIPVLPLYIRPSDAEINLAKRIKGKALIFQRQRGQVCS